MYHKHIRYLFFLFVILVCGCEEEGPDIDVESAIPVTVETITLGEIKEYVFATGTVRAAREAELIAEQPGSYSLLTNPRTGKPFAMGDRVAAGDLIARLANPELENQVMLDSKKLNYEISEREFTKQKQLFEKGGVTLRELTDAERAYIDARYSYDNARLQLDKLKITAPFDGILVNLTYYTPAQQLNINSPIARVMEYRKLYCELSLPESEMPRVAVDQHAAVTNYTHPDDTLGAVVAQVSPALDPASRMFAVTVTIDNDSLLLRPGMFVKVDIVVAKKESAVVIPKDVVLERRGGKRVFVAEKGIAVERKIEIGLSNPDRVEVLSGLEADERLIITGFETLRHRSRIKVLK
ncbi:MAG: efflux RND transporter periplasmic adaptor subunit [candidate division Zixibacteria bacterium]|nr:efflux RND transporter periplasmic adaptor subunit [candidate division Zixibacteria bacterium]